MLGDSAILARPTTPSSFVAGDPPPKSESCFMKRRAFEYAMGMQKASCAFATRLTATISTVSTLAMATLLACTEEEARPPYALEGSADGSPCERAGFRCSFGNFGCSEGSFSAGKSLGCPGETAVCCLPKSDAGEAGVPLDAPAETSASDASDTSDTSASDASASDASNQFDADANG